MAEDGVRQPSFRLPYLSWVVKSERRSRRRLS